MGFFKRLGLLIHMLFFLAIGAVLILLSLNIFSPDEVAGAVNFVYTDPNVKLALGITGMIFALAGVIHMQLNRGKMQREKTIAFENPEGQVTVSLSAIEDFVKKSVQHLSEVRELKADVSAGKKGISVVCRATIYADSNIPEITERVQSIVKTKVQEMLGVEEAISIKINVTKISSKGGGDEARMPKEHEESSRRMPLGHVD